MKREKRTWLSLMLIIVMMASMGFPCAAPLFADGEAMVGLETKAATTTTTTTTTGGALSLEAVPPKPSESLPSPVVPVVPVLPMMTAAPVAAPLPTPWTVGDFTYDKITLQDTWGNQVPRVAITGFSSQGLEKFKTNKDVVLSAVSDSGEPITAIKQNAFFNNKKKSDSVNGMKSVVIPATVKEIQDLAFSGNALSQLDVSGELENIGPFAFAYNPITDIKLGNKLDTISAGAFVGNSLRSVILPASLRNLLGAALLKGDASTITFVKLDEAIRDAEALPEASRSEALKAALKQAKDARSAIKAADTATLKNILNLAKGITDNLSAAKVSVLQSVVPLQDTYVPLGASQSDALNQLPVSAVLLDVDGKPHAAAIKSWRLEGYNGTALGECQATATAELPGDLVQPASPISLALAVKVHVVNAIANSADFTYQGTAITGFSAVGSEKFKTCKFVVLPAKNPSGQPITEIADKAFLGQIRTMQDENFGINVVVIPSSVTVIGAEAFRYNALKGVEIPKSVKTIKTMAFNGNLLQTLDLPESVTDLEPGAFTLNKIASLKLTGNLKTITAAFSYNKLTSVTIPEGVTRIDDMAFGDNDLKTAILPKSLEYLSGFNNNEFTSITIPSGVKELGKKAFARNRIKEVVIPSNVKIIGESAFQNSWHDVYLEKITLNEGLEKLDRFAFSSNYLREVELPSTLKVLDSSAFYKNIGYNDSRVTYLYTKDHQNPNKLANARYHVINPAKLTMSYVLNGTELKSEILLAHPKNKTVFSMGDVIKIAPSYKNTAYELVDPNEIEIKLSAKDNKAVFDLRVKSVQDVPVIETIGHVNVVSVPFGASPTDVLKKLAKKSFVFDTNGKEYPVELSWQLPGFNGNQSGEYIAKATFAVPTGLGQTTSSLRPELETLVIVKKNPEALKSSPWNVDDFVIQNAFLNNDDQVAIMGFSPQGEEKLKTNKALVLPKTNRDGEQITLIAKEAFENKGLTSLVIPEGLERLEIDAAAFQENQLSTVILPDGVKEIETYAFYSNELRYVDIPKTVWKIGNRAFADNKLVSVDFSLDIENVFLDRFSFDNNQLMEVTIVKEVGKIHSEAFKDNLGYGNNKNRVKIYTLNLDVEDQNHVFPFSPYHEMILLKIENIDDVPGLKDHVELTLSNGDKVKVHENKCKSQDFNQKRKEQQASKNKNNNGGAAGGAGGAANGKNTVDGQKSPGQKQTPVANGVPQKVTGQPTPQGKVQKNKTEIPNKTVFKDMVKAPWAQDAVHELWEKKIISGYKSEYKPEGKMTKAEFASILVKAFEIEEANGASKFSDVKKSDWHYDAITKLAALEIISGDGSGKFNPDETITREQMIKMLMQLMNSRYPERMNSSDTPVAFKDQSKISSWAEDAFGQAMSLKLISGFSDETLKPQATTTRAQAAVVVQKALKLME